MIAIPLADLNDFVVEALLDDLTYFLRFSWNSEAEFWTLNIEDANNNSILGGMVLVPNVGLLEDFRAYRVPPGELIVHTDRLGISVGRNSFIEEQATLYYVTEEEYATL